MKDIKNTFNSSNSKVANLEDRTRVLIKNRNEMKVTYSNNQIISSKLKSNFEQIENIYNGLIPILELYFDYKMPFLSNPEAMKNFSFSFSLYILFILKYPSHLTIL